jgi:DNA-binding NarL/FixJ family response regulator
LIASSTAANQSTPSATVLVRTAPRSKAAVAIVADGQLSVAALEALILRTGSYCVAQRARGVELVREVLAAFAPAVVVVEGGWSVWRNAIGSHPSAARTLLLLDPEDNSAQFVQAVRAQAEGYLSRTATCEGFTMAIDRLREGGSYVDPALAEPLRRAEADPGAEADWLRPELSRRERDILVGVANGWSSKEIAQRHAIAPKTVCNHVHNIRQKLKLRHRGQLVLYAAKHGLTTF